MLAAMGLALSKVFCRLPFQYCNIPQAMYDLAASSPASAPTKLPPNVLHVREAQSYRLHLPSPPLTTCFVLQSLVQQLAPCVWSQQQSPGTCILTDDFVTFRLGSASLVSTSCQVWQRCMADSHQPDSLLECIPDILKIVLHKK